MTARRVEERLQTVPVAVTAYSGAALQQQTVRTLTETGHLTPSLTFAPALTSLGAAVNIQMRGQVQEDTLATIDPSVGTYVDGVYWARAYGMNATMVDIDNFQALKGPQGTLFGRNTSGGAILINTNDPSFSKGFSGSLSGTAGNFNYQSLTAIVNVPLIADKLAARLVYQGDKRDAYVRNLTTGTMLNNMDDYTFRGKLLAQVTDDFRVLFSFEKFHDTALVDSGRTGYFVPFGLASFEGGLERLGPAGCFASLGACLALGNQILASDMALRQDQFHTSLTGDPRETTDTETYAVTTTYDTSFGAVVKGIGAYRHIRSVLENADNDASSVRILDSAGLVGSLAATQDIWQWSGEVTVTGKAFDNKLDYAAGALYFHEEGVDGTPASTFTALGELRTGGLRPITVSNASPLTTSKGIYGQATYHLTDRLSLTGGVRYSVDNKGLLSRNGTQIGLPAVTFICGYPTGCPNFRTAAFPGWSYTADVDYKLTDQVFLYAKTAKGFRAGGQSLRAIGDIPQSLNPFAPEVAYSYEAGVKSQFFDNRLRINLDAYYTDEKNVQRTTVLVSGTTTASITENAAAVKIWGAEFEGSLLLPEGFRIDATGAYTYPKYDKFIDATGFDRSHEPFVDTPRWTASVSPTWQHQIDVGTINARVDFAYQSKMYDFPTGFYTDASGVVHDASTGQVFTAADAAGFTAANTDKSHVLVNARLGLTLRDGTVEVALWAKNLTNLKDYVAALPITAVNEARSVLREPRTYGITATVHFE